jgi:hypothetical protein
MINSRQVFDKKRLAEVAQPFPSQASWLSSPIIFPRDVLSNRLGGNNESFSISFRCHGVATLRRIENLPIRN